MPHNWIVVHNQDDPAELLDQIYGETNRIIDRDKVEVYWDLHSTTAYLWIDTASVQEIKALGWALNAIEVVTVLDEAEAREAFALRSGEES